MVDGGGLENRCAGFPVPRVRISAPPFIDSFYLLLEFAIPGDFKGQSPLGEGVADYPPKAGKQRGGDFPP